MLRDVKLHTPCVMPALLVYAGRRSSWCRTARSRLPSCGCWQQSWRCGGLLRLHCLLRLQCLLACMHACTARARCAAAAVCMRLTRGFIAAAAPIAAARPQIRSKRLPAARKILGMALGSCPKAKLFREYIQLELTLGNIDRWAGCALLLRVVCFCTAAAPAAPAAVCFLLSLTVLQLHITACHPMCCCSVQPLRLHARACTAIVPPLYCLPARCRILYEKYLEWNPANAAAWLK